MGESTHITFTKKRNSKTEAGVTLPGYVIISNEGASMETENSAAAEPTTAPHRTQEQYLQLPMSSPGARNEAQLLSLKDSGKAKPNALSLLLCRVGEVE